ncbi:hypothetical protein RGAI101_1935 [Roseobacter sp. GAI101]|nr:hypothetical protein RGAI101_1935 [Roseobacter sp. GAI101]
MKKGWFLVHLPDYETELRMKVQPSKDAADKLGKNIRREARQTYSAIEVIRIISAGVCGKERIPML